MRTIYKYPIPVDDQWHEVPLGNVVDVQRSDVPNIVLVWVDHFDNHALKIKLRVYGTGHPLPENAEHVGTAHHAPFVWHVLREIKGPWNTGKV